MIAAYAKYSSSHGIREALNLNFLLCHLIFDFLRVHQKIKYYISYCAFCIKKHNKEICIVFFEKKPLICQAGSAEAFAVSPAAGNEHRNCSAY